MSNNIKKVRLNSKINCGSQTNESIMQYYFQYPREDDTSSVNIGTTIGTDKDSDQPKIDYVPSLFPNSTEASVSSFKSFNNTEDIRKIFTYLDFLYENGDVFVDGKWYKSPMLAIQEYPTGLAGVKTAILNGKVFRRIGCNKIY